MGLFDFFSKKKINTIVPTFPTNSQIAIQQGIVTWQGADAQSFVNDGYVGNDIVYSIVKLITDGNTNAEIADILFLSIRTVDTHRKNILYKLGLNNTATLVKYAIENKIFLGLD